MRTFALTLIIISEIIIALSWNVDMDTGSLSFLTTLIIVVIAAFTFSALLRNFKSLTLTRNYLFSGLVGVVAGILFYAWIKDHLDSLLNWLKTYGPYYLLAIIFISALILYLVPQKKKSVDKPANIEPKPTSISSSPDQENSSKEDTSPI